MKKRSDERIPGSFIEKTLNQAGLKDSCFWLDF
jgi:hypothetical protein